ncbi:MAG: hypothetical protein KDN05_06025, partial [Verrucomicrobiae bacterium]|nr:hypothetical protein [Verrucomicrobiae bacterium]
HRPVHRAQWLDSGESSYGPAAEFLCQNSNPAADGMMIVEHRLRIFEGEEERAKLTRSLVSPEPGFVAAPRRAHFQIHAVRFTAHNGSTRESQATVLPAYRFS